jgi:hypothetical protein
MKLADWSISASAKVDQTPFGINPGAHYFQVQVTPPSFLVMVFTSGMSQAEMSM